MYGYMAIFSLKKENELIVKTPFHVAKHVI